LQRPVYLAQNGIVKYGYARVSTEDQNASVQRTVLKKHGCKKIFTDDGQSGATTNRPEFQKCLKKLATGDSLTVWKLDRLGRSLRDLIIILDDFKDRGVEFGSLTETIDTESATGRAMWQAIGILAELERSPIKERTQAGIAAAKARGVQFGRKRILKPYQVQQIRKPIHAGEGPSDVAESLNIGRSTLYRALAN
jgi:DNA invertase Pin-like site-specific DNA recombinase